MGVVVLPETRGKFLSPPQTTKIKPLMEVKNRPYPLNLIPSGVLQLFFSSFAPSGGSQQKTNYGEIKRYRLTSGDSSKYSKNKLMSKCWRWPIIFHGQWLQTECYLTPQPRTLGVWSLELELVRLPKVRPLSATIPPGVISQRVWEIMTRENSRNKL